MNPWLDLPTWRRTSFGLARRFMELGGIINARLSFALIRSGPSSLMLPEGFALPHPNAIVSYYDMFVERNLDGPWLHNVRNAVDVGYNWGMFTRRLLLFSPGATVIAFEPNHAVYEIGKHNVPANVFLNKVALCDKTGRANYFRSRCGMNGALDQRHHRGSPVEINTATLDCWTSADGKMIDLLKVDIDGNELAFLKGAKDAIHKTKWLLIEYYDGIEVLLPHIPKPMEIRSLPCHNYAIRLS